jgi:hypothetical protein
VTHITKAARQGAGLGRQINKRRKEGTAGKEKRQGKAQNSGKAMHEIQMKQNRECKQRKLFVKVRQSKKFVHHGKYIMVGNSDNAKNSLSKKQKSKAHKLRH